MSRLMAKTFDVELGEKGSPFQSKINAYTQGKDIKQVHDLALSVESVDGKDHVRALMLEERGDGEASRDARIYAKEIRGPLGDTNTSTKVNSFSKGKDISVVGAYSAITSDGEYFGVILYTKEGGDAEADQQANAAAAADPSATQDAPTEQPVGATA